MSSGDWREAEGKGNPKPLLTATCLVPSLWCSWETEPIRKLLEKPEREVSGPLHKAWGETSSLMTHRALPHLLLFTLLSALHHPPLT